MSGNVVGNLKVRLDFDGSQFEQGITQAKRELSTWNRATKLSTKIAKDNNFSMRETGDALHNMRGRYKSISSSIDVYKKQQEKMIKNGTHQSDAMKNNQKAVKNLEYDLIELNNEYKQFQKEAITAQSSFTKFGKGAEAVGGTMITLGDGVSKVGAGITKAGLASMATFGMAGKVAMDFEQGLAGVQKTTNASAAEMEVLEGNIREMAMEMPIATNKLLALGEQAGQLGIAQADIADFTKVMAMMGTATNLSATEAGESFARFINITGSGMDSLENLGSSVVHLGNNFATTESEIMNLAMGLAGSLTTVGVADHQILGLSAGMGALGINAERGASSMSKFFIEMAQDVATGSGNLENFAKVAGVSTKEFQQAFEEDAMGAMETFIKGLGEMGESGEDVIGVLSEMGINEIRLRDTVLRLASGHEVLSDALDHSKDGYSENVALMEEYELLAGTTASQVEIAKNKLKDMALTIGQQLLPVMVDMINDSDGIVESLKGAVDWFVNLDDGMKENLVRWTAMALVIGPVASGLGNVMSGMGGVITTIGGLSQGIGKLEGVVKSRLLPNLDGSVEGFGKMADGAVLAGGSQGLGSLVTSIATAHPVISGLVAAGGLLALGYAGYKLWGEEAIKAGQRTKRWGTDVGGIADETLSDIQRQFSRTEGEFSSMSSSIHTSSGGVIQDFTSIGGAIETGINNQLAMMSDYISALPEEVRSSQEEIIDNHVAGLNRTQEIVAENTKKANVIYDNAMKERGYLLEHEMNAIRAIERDSMDRYLGVLELGADEERRIRKLLQMDVNEMSKDQSKEMFDFYQEQTLLHEQNAESALRTHQDLLEDSGLNIHSGLGKELYDDMVEFYAETAEHNRNGMLEMAAVNEDIVYLFDLETGRMLQGGVEANQVTIENNKKAVAEFKGQADDMKNVTEDVGKATEYMLDETSKGYQAWNDAILASDGSVDDFRIKLSEASKDATTWNHIRFQIHNADLDSNAKSIIGEVALENGRWEALDWEEKQAILQDKFSITMYEALVESGKWEEMELKEKQAIVTSNTPEKMTEALIHLGLYDEYEVEIKEANADNLDLLLKLKDSEVALNRWKGLEDRDDRDMLVNNKDFLDKIKGSEKEWNDFVALEDETKTAKAVTAPFDSNVKQSNTHWSNFIRRPSSTTKTPKADTSNFNTDVGKATSEYDTLRNRPATTTKTAVLKRRTIFEKIMGTGYAEGTNFHQGGMAIVNDERSHRFRELVTLPSGESFIPQGRDVPLNLPRGSKVLRASLTKQMFPDIPQYAKGVGLQSATVPRNFGEPTDSETTNFGKLQRQIDNMLQQLSGMTQQPATTSGVSINIGKIENNSDSDIPRILEEAAWILQGEGNRLNG